MGVQSKSNWGRSFVSANSEVENQLVRVRLPQPRDLTLYLQPLRQADTGLPTSAVVTYRVTIGSGGIALVNAWIPTPQVGLARHFVADAIDVTAVVPGVNRRSVAANVAIGTPYEAVEPAAYMGFEPIGAVLTARLPEFLTARGQSFTWRQIDPGNDYFFRIPPFATHFQIRTRLNNGAAAGEMQVFSVGPTGGVGAVGLVSDFSLVTPLEPNAVMLSLRCTNANPLTHYDALVTFTVKM